MSASSSSTSLAGFVTEAPVQLGLGAQHRGSDASALRNRSEHLNTRENGLRRRARRQALVLMMASSVISIVALYGIWTLLSGGI